MHLKKNKIKGKRKKAKTTTHDPQVLYLAEKIHQLSFYLIIIVTYVLFP